VLHVDTTCSHQEWHCSPGEEQTAVDHCYLQKRTPRQPSLSSTQASCAPWRKEAGSWQPLLMSWPGADMLACRATSASTPFPPHRPRRPLCGGCIMHSANRACCVQGRLPTLWPRTPAMWFPQCAAQPRQRCARFCWCRRCRQQWQQVQVGPNEIPCQRGTWGVWRGMKRCVWGGGGGGGFGTLLFIVCVTAGGTWVVARQVARHGMHDGR
jgi:hypothetical protein